jgi:4-phytase / acid phosphatase
VKIISLVLLLALYASYLPAQSEATSTRRGAAQTEITSEHLLFAIVLTRHGVRSPTGKVARLNLYSTQPWPHWNVPPGDLTARGAQLMTLFGAYYRDYFAQQGLLTDARCGDAARISFVADSDERTRATGNAIADGMFPDCSVVVHSLPPGTPDPLFHPLAAGVGHPDQDQAAAAVAGRIGNDPAALASAYRQSLQGMAHILSLCDPPAHCQQPQKSLLGEKSSVGPAKGNHLVDLKGPMSTASTIAEDLLLEYTEGMPVEKVGWGHVDEAKLDEFLVLHTAHADLLQRTPYLARTQASNLLIHILATLQQAIDGKKVAGAVGDPKDKVLFLIGHDTNIATVAGTLRLSWIVDGRRDDTPPGGALVFELWGLGDHSSVRVRTYFVSQTLRQMREIMPLTLATPPAKAPIFIPGCSDADRQYSCQWPLFRQALQSAIDPAFSR